AYATLLAGLGAALVLGFGLYGRQFEPLTGDLTRIGWYPENAFGWTAPDHRFTPPLAEPGRLDGTYDVIVVGDSFSVDESDRIGANWPHFLARDSGLGVGVFDSGVTALETVLAGPVFRDHPPAALIYEIVERSLVPQHRHSGTADCAATTATPRPSRAIARRPDEPASVFRRT